MGQQNQNYTCAQESEGVKIGWIKLVLILVALFGGVKLIKAFNAEKTQPQYKISDPFVKKEVPFILQPGESKIIETHDKTTGELYEFTVKWDVYSENSYLHVSNHNIYGKDGIGGRLVGALVRPEKGDGFANGGIVNTRVFYIHIHNDGPDPVAGVASLWGQEMVEIPPKTK